MLGLNLYGIIAGAWIISMAGLWVYKEIDQGFAVRAAIQRENEQCQKDITILLDSIDNQSKKAINDANEAAIAFVPSSDIDSLCKQAECRDSE
jgi:hypothetical protein